MPYKRQQQLQRRNIDEWNIHVRAQTLDGGNDAFDWLIATY